VCKCVLYYCHLVSTQLQLNISYPMSKLWPNLLTYVINFTIKFHIVCNDKFFALVNCYAVYVGRSLPMFWDKLSDPPSIVPNDCHTRSLSNKQLTLHKIPEDQRPLLHRGISLKYHICCVHCRANRRGALVPFFTSRHISLHTLFYLSKTNTEVCLLYQVPKMKIQPYKH